MSSAPTIDDRTLHTAPQAAASAASRLLVCLPTLAPDVLQATLSRLNEAFSAGDLLVATPDAVPTQNQWPRVEWIKRTASANEQPASGWVLGAADYAYAAGVCNERGAPSVLLLGGNPADLSADVLARLIDGVRDSQNDLAVPRFSPGTGSSLVTAALLYPLTRALFAADIRFPLPADAACSARMIQRLGFGSRNARAGASPSMMWPVAEATVAGYSVREVEAGEASPPQPQESEFNALFQSITSSLFADIEAKASFWQRFRSHAPRTAPPTTAGLPPTADVHAEIGGMIDAFHLAHANLQEIWSMVLPPQTRLALKKLSVQPAANFAFDPNLWV